MCVSVVYVLMNNCHGMSLHEHIGLTIVYDCVILPMIACGTDIIVGFTVFCMKFAHIVCTPTKTYSYLGTHVCDF